MALLFMRHGSTGANAGDSDPNLGLDNKDYFRGWTDLPLSPLGQQQAAQTAAWFKQFPVQRIVSSDMVRAVQTAQMISKVTGAQVTTDPRLRPMDVGQFSGQEVTPERAKVVEDAHKPENWNRSMGAGMEPYGQFIQRYTSILPELLQAGQQGNIAVVAHHRNLLALPHLFFGKELSTKGPPDPGGVMALTQKGLYTLYEPTAGSAAYKEKAAS